MEELRGAPLSKAESKIFLKVCQDIACIIPLISTCRSPKRDFLEPTSDCFLKVKQPFSVTVCQESCW